MFKTCPKCGVTWEPAKGTKASRIATGICAGCDSTQMPREDREARADEVRTMVSQQSDRRRVFGRRQEATSIEPRQPKEIRVVGVKAEGRAMGKEEFLQRYVLNQCNSNTAWDGKQIAQQAIECWEAIQAAIQP